MAGLASGTDWEFLVEDFAGGFGAGVWPKSEAAVKSARGIAKARRKVAGLGNGLILVVIENWTIVSQSAGNRMET